MIEVETITLITNAKANTLENNHDYKYNWTGDENDECYSYDYGELKKQKKFKEIVSFIASNA